MANAAEAAPRPRAVAWVVAVAMFMAILEGTIIAAALPHMAADFGVQPIALSAGITAYLLVSAMLLPLSSWVAERLGTRRVFLVAILGFAGASLLCGVAQGLGGFVAARALQALFASLMVPVGNLVLLRVTPKRELVSVMAISTTPALIAPVLGPPLGGFITEFIGWRWIFFINLPMALVGAAMILRVVPDLREVGRRRFDWTGFALSAGAVGALVLGVDRLGAHPEHWGWPAALLVVAVGLAVAGVRHARRAAEPLVPLTALRHRTFTSIAFGAGFLARLPFLAHSILLPLYFQVGFGLSAVATGTLLLAQNAGDLALKPIAGRVLRRVGFRRALTWGSVVMVAAYAGCAFLTPAMGFAGLCAALFAVGMARSIAFTAMMALSFADVTEGELGGASVLNSLANSVSAAVGISLGALLLNLGLGAGWPLGEYRVALLVLAAVGAVAIPLFARLPHDAGAEVSGHRRVEVVV